MKRLLLILGLTLLASVCLAQPYKIVNDRVHQVWGADIIKQYIYNRVPANMDSAYYDATCPAIFAWDSVYWPEFKPGIADTNILFVDAATGKVRITSPAAIGGAAASKWTYNGAWLRQIDTTKRVVIGSAIGTDTFDLQVRYSDILINGIRAGKGGAYKSTNTAFGRNALYQNTGGTENTAFGYTALQGNNGGTGNTAFGNAALSSCQNANTNSAFGSGALFGTSTGGGNCAFGSAAMQYNTTGATNVAIGQSAMALGDSANNNVAIGYSAGTNQNNRNGIFIGYSAGVHTNKKNVFILDGLYRLDSTATRTNAMFYGVMDNVDSIQYLRINSRVRIGNGYWLPFRDGNAGEVLTTDGSGVVSWAAGGGGGIPADSVPFRRVANSIFAKSSAAFSITGTTGSTPGSGARTTMMWIPDKAAFRAGMSLGTSMDAGSIGDNSFSGSYNATASGLGSMAWGSNTTASGDKAYAGGQSSTASASWSFVHGYGSSAGGDASVCFGQSTSALANYSSAFGFTTTASGVSSFAANLYTTAQPYGASAFGRYNVVTGTTGSWVSTDPLFQIGNGTGTGGSSNDAFKVLKNGDTYIADGSSTTDPIMTVKATDSTTTIIGDVNQSNGFGNFNVAYGSYIDTTDQAPYVSTKNKAIRFNVTDAESGMTLAANDTVITINVTGKYLITFSAVMLPSAASKTFNIFACKNGSAYPMSNTIWKSVGVNQARIVTVTYIIPFTAGETFGLCWQTDDGSALLDFTTRQTSPTRPVCPSIILTLNKISN